MIAAQYTNPADVQLPGHRWRHNVMCCTSGRLVYVRNLKCASTFFYENFKQKFHWWSISWKDIDWQNQRVFGHIMDPWQRRIKGLAECLHMNKLDKQFANDPEFRQFIVNIPFLDQHSTSYHDYFGNLAWFVDWIPVQADPNGTIDLTEKFLSHHNINILGRWDMGWAHIGEPDKKHTENLIRAEIKKQTSIPDHVSTYFHNDCELWQTVVQKFKPNELEWPQISWLDQPSAIV
jgi:hypothetical protein